MTDEQRERKELAKEIVSELKKDASYGECRLFSRQQADSLRSFADHWEENKDSYFGLCRIGHALDSVTSKIWITTIGLAIFGIFVLALTGMVEKIKGLIE